MRNIHERIIDVPPERMGPLLDRLAGEDDPLWPAPAWPPMLLDRPLAVGADGGHDGVRYAVEEYEPGSRVRFRFKPEVGLDGYHELAVVPAPAGCRLRHMIVARTRGGMRLVWPLAVRWLHDALLEDLLDNAERATIGAVRRPARWSPWVRFLHGRVWPRPKAVPIPPAARLARAAFDQTDLADAYRVPRSRGTPADPAVWADAIFDDPPRWVARLLALRNRLVGLVGIARGDHSAFARVARDGDEILLGTDDGHLDFRASILVEPAAVTVTNVARTNNRRGRLYLRVIRPFHAPVVRAMLRRASRNLSLAAHRVDHEVGNAGARRS